jgi:hypothetical protein
MFKGYRNHLLEKDKTNKGIKSLDHVNKCTKCNRLNPSLHSSALNNIQVCLFCGNPFYIVKNDKYSH